MENIKYCSQCGKTFTDLSISFCPFDATTLAEMQPARQEAEQSTPPQVEEKRNEEREFVYFGPDNSAKKVSNLLGFGIFLMPYIFAWFTLQKGYSNLARIVSFSWLAVIIVPQLIIYSNSSKSAFDSYKDESRVSKPSNPSGFASATTTPVTRLSPKETAMAQAKIDFRWKKDGFGTVMVVDFTIHNPSIYAIKDIEVTCTQFASSGTTLDSTTRTIYEIIPAKDKKIIRDFNMGFIHPQSSSSTCKILDLVAIP